MSAVRFATAAISFTAGATIAGYFATQRRREIPHEPSSSIKARLESLPIIKSIRAQPHVEVVPFRPKLADAVGDAIREDESGAKLGFKRTPGEIVHEDPAGYRNSLLRGTLYGPGMIEYAFGLYSRDDRALVKITELGSELCGHPGVVHGGMISALFDDFMGTLFLLNAEGAYSGFTANLNVDYRSPMPAQSTIALVIWIDRVEGRKVFLKGEARSIGNVEGASESGSIGEKWAGVGGVKYAEATSLYIIPKRQYEALQRNKSA
ncbi:Thioesterase super member 4 [Irineochytrium annulatum]|nr:Thioesterase super member 4 [Irineochytrium annulatum]